MLFLFSIALTIACVVGEVGNSVNATTYNLSSAQSRRIQGGLTSWQIGLIATKGLLVILGLFACYLRARKRRRDQELLLKNAPVIVTSTTTTTAPGGYPVTVQSTPGGGLQATPYSGHTAMPMPQPQMMANPPYPSHPGAMPQPYGTIQGYVANPPYPLNESHRMNPPSYDQVVSSEATQKQAPYNPNYMGN